MKQSNDILFLVFLLSALSPAVAASNGNATDTEAQIDQTENVVCYETFFQ